MGSPLLLEEGIRDLDLINEVVEEGLWPKFLGCIARDKATQKSALNESVGIGSQIPWKLLVISSANKASHSTLISTERGESLKWIGTANFIHDDCGGWPGAGDLDHFVGQFSPLNTVQSSTSK